MTNCVELRHLRYFVAVAEALSFVKAAKILHISQPPLSRQIRDLESSIGTPLLERGKTGICLTEAGQVFLLDSKNILEQVALSLRHAMRASRGELGRIDLAYAPFLEATAVPYLTRAFEAQSPGIKLAFQRLSSEDQPTWIRNSIVEAGFLTLPVWDTDQLTTEPLFRESAVAIVSTRHPLARGRSVSLSQVAEFAVAQVHDQSTPLNCDPLTRIATMCGVPLPNRVPEESFEGVMRRVECADAVAILPSSARHCGGTDIRRLKIRDRNADFTFGIAYRRDCISTRLANLLTIARQMNTTAAVTLDVIPKLVVMKTARS